MRSPHFTDWATAAVLLAVPIALIASLPAAGTPGWDESGHVFAALRMTAALREHGVRAFGEELVRSDYYTPLGRACYVPALALLGSAWWVPRLVGVLAWAATVFLATRLARRLVPAEAAPHAALWTAAFGATCTLGANHARTAFLEPISAFACAGLAWSFVRCTERPTARRAALVGALAAFGVLVKPTYGLLGIAACAVACVVPYAYRRVRARADAGGAELPRGRALAAGVAVFALPFLWWFVVPWPGGAALAAEHRALFADYLTKAASLEGLPRSDLLLVFGLQAAWSLPAAALQGLGVLLVVRRLESRAWTLVAAIAVGGLLAFLVYPYRIERFLVPGLFALWCTGGALCAAGALRIGARARPYVVLATALLVGGTTGIGSEALWAAVRGAPVNPTQKERIAAALHAWREPYAHVPAPACGGAEIQRVLDAAARDLDGARPFGWIGGTCTEIPFTLVRWRLFQDRPRTADLEWSPEPVDHLWSDPGWDEAAFRAWAARFEQVVVLDPPDPRDRPVRRFEARFVEWMARAPEFALAAETRVERTGRSDVLCRVYRRAR